MDCAPSERVAGSALSALENQQWGTADASSLALAADLSEHRGIPAAAELVAQPPSHRSRAHDTGAHHPAVPPGTLESRGGTARGHDRADGLQMATAFRSRACPRAS